MAEDWMELARLVFYRPRDATGEPGKQRGTTARENDEVGSLPIGRRDSNHRRPTIPPAAGTPEDDVWNAS